jgi:hypothetical protein
MPKHNAFDAFWAFSQSARAAPLNPAHELAAAAGAVVEPVCDCASNGAAKTNEVAQAIALNLQIFINPPFVNRTRCDS